MNSKNHLVRKHSFFLKQEKQLSFLNLLLLSMIKKGKKEKAFQILLNLLFKLKESEELNEKQPIKIFNLAMKKTMNYFELQKTLKGKIVAEKLDIIITQPRIFRNSIKSVLKNSNLRILELNFVDKLYNEIFDIFVGKGLTLKRKREFFSLLNKKRVYFTNIKRKKRRRKKIQRL